MSIQNKYNNYYRSNNRDISKNKRHSALQQALDIRKFEIDLYWKRATYFWGFLIVIFGGYFTVLFTTDGSFKSETLILISCLGMLFSLGWFLVNKGSKFWQNNWERHVDFLEDEFMGPLYKLVITQKPKSSYNLLIHIKRGILQESNYSVSKINQALSFFICSIWTFLFVGSSYKYFVHEDLKIGDLEITFNGLFMFFIFYTLSFAIFMSIACKSNHKQKQTSVFIKRR